MEIIDPKEEILESIIFTKNFKEKDDIRVVRRYTPETYEKILQHLKPDKTVLLRAQSGYPEFHGWSIYIKSANLNLIYR
ncbi:MAG: hypothetical protein LH629_15890 [Ignavibacteria bacterium]|nr:hypothetical protein [Ignavibacteria bacterium]